jgi:hypothetical protein
MLHLEIAPREIAELAVTQPATPAIESAETSQTDAANDARGKFCAQPAVISLEERHENLIGRAAIRNRSNPRKTKGALPF